MANEKIICPAISIIIPLYNAERYVGECLDSVLNQTFQDFELIVVDDCSTDNSVAFVESYAPKFDGRLRLAKTKKNSGGAGFPRNKGVELSRGEYVYFIDPDDTITLTALEELYYHAKNFDADVVQCEKFYEIPEKFWGDAEFRKNLKPSSYLTGEKVLIKEPVVWADNFEERVKFYSSRQLIWNVVTQIIRRDFILDNELRFCNIFGEDTAFSTCEICCARKYVIVPNVIYNYRRHEGSATLPKKDMVNRLQRNIKALRVGTNYIDEFLKGLDFFSRRPDLRYTLLETFVDEILRQFNLIYAYFPAYSFDETLKQAFAEGDNTALTAHIFSKMNVYRLQLIQAQSENARLQREFVRLKSQVERIADKLRQE